MTDDVIKLGDELNWSAAEAYLRSLGARPSLAIDAMTDACMFDTPQQVAGHHDVLYTVTYLPASGRYAITESGGES